MPDPLLTFETTHHALWAEEVAMEHGIAAEVVPAPPAARARCNLALRSLPEDMDRLTEVLRDRGVPYAVHGAAE